jgi:hypothetical protein
MSRKKDRLRSLIEHAPATKVKSAYVAAIREVIWCEGQPGVSDYLRQVNHASKVLLTHPDLRVVRFPASQGEVFLTYGHDLMDAGSQSRPPFDHTFYDLGFMNVGLHEMVGASVYWDDLHAGWAAVFYLREKGTDDWSSHFLSSDSVQTGKGKVESIGPAYGRPPAETASAAAARVVAGVLVFLESANVDLVDAVPLPKGHQAFGIPHHEVLVRQQKRRLVYPDGHQPAESSWSHRWEVRGHFKHFRRGAVYEKNVERRVHTADGDEFVRIWCPPFVKGPEDKPLVPKLRRVAV